MKKDQKLLENWKNSWIQYQTKFPMTDLRVFT